MLTLILVLSTLNLVGLLIAGTVYFKDHFIISRIEEWNTIATCFNECVELDIVDGEGHITTQELAGGVGVPVESGFFRDEIPDDGEEEEE